MILTMKKFHLVCMKDERERLLSALQKFGNVELCAAEDGIKADSNSHTESQRRLENIIKELKPYAKKKPMFSQKPEVELDEMYRTTNVETSLAKAEELIEKIAALEKRMAQNKELCQTISEWTALKTPIEELSDGKYTKSLLASLPGTLTHEQINEAISPVCAYEIIFTNPNKTGLLMTGLKEDINSSLSDLKLMGLEIITLPLSSGTVSDNLRQLEADVKDCGLEIQKTDKEIRRLSDECEDSFKLSFEKERAAGDRSEVRLDATRNTVVIKGWVPEKHTDALEKLLSEELEVYDLFFTDPEEGEEVPTHLENNKAVSQFESITNMFNAPKYGEVDPNPVMAPWYWIIFGMMMGDAGYGILLALLIVAAKLVMKPRGTTLQLMNVMLYSSATTVIFGVLFGSWFGEELFPALIGFTAMDDPIKMLIITLVVGVLHIFTGMICKMVQLIKAGHWLDALFDQLSWMMIISGIGMIFIKSLKNVGMAVAIAGAIIVLFTAGRSKKGIVGKFTGGLLGLYGITSYFSDILSYSRILALGLATGVVGMVMNMLAGMIQGSVIGFILSLVVYAVGHIFNLALGLLSAYVHDCRLQYIEFYGKFYDGGGKLFSPFKIKTNYINIKK